MKTPFFDRHVALGAKMVSFAGWEMPIQYKGILHEHEAVRKRAGLFDVSHMARVAVKGKEASQFFEWISTNKLHGPGRATYTCFCNDLGGTVDDAMVYKESDTSLFVIINASRRQIDLNHFKNQAKRFDVAIEEPFHKEGILALQGPEAGRYLPKIPYMTFRQEGELIFSGTGYTGSGGIEIFGPENQLISLWDQLIREGVEPIGLGARDTLRLEKGYALYGHELSETISPTESVSAWTVKLEKDFLGKERLSTRRKAYGVRVNDPALPREGFRIFSNEIPIGYVTSGGFSPTLKVPIALILSEKPLQPSDPLTIEIRGRQISASVTSLPFI